MAHFSFVSFKLCYIFFKRFDVLFNYNIFQVASVCGGEKGGARGGEGKKYQIFKHESEFKKLSDINLKFTSLASNSI